MEHLHQLIDNPETRNDYSHLRNETTKEWIERDDVIIKFDDKVGRLKVGYGDVKEDGRQFFGPDIEFGWYVPVV